ncbi:MAG: hypothetical protein HY080_14590 [Gammaproteobacteria bacterium]|nr:hypothetical protein [Gammaproteobacteria bacterium]
MRLVLTIMLFACGCSLAIGSGPDPAADPECLFKFSAEPTCAYKSGTTDIQVSIVTEALKKNKISLKEANVTIDGMPQKLILSPDVRMFARNIGTILFADINFDGMPDLAISTSFGLANEYFDYWVYDAKLQQYQKIGNYPRFKLNPKTKILSTVVKDGAATYIKQKYRWKGTTLVEIK